MATSKIDVICQYVVVFVYFSINLDLDIFSPIELTLLLETKKTNFDSLKKQNWPIIGDQKNR